MSDIIRVVGASGTLIDLPNAVATGLLASGVVTRVEVAEKPLTAAQQKKADTKAADELQDQARETVARTEEVKAALSKARAEHKAAEAKGEDPEAAASTDTKTK